MNIWKRLGIDPTEDVRAIKRAYTKLAREIDPDSQMEDFLNLRQAYESALLYTEGVETQELTVEIHEEDSITPEKEVEIQSETPKTEETAPLIQVDFIHQVDDRYADSPAITKLKVLYLEKNCKEEKIWLNFFTSPDFLSVYKEESFTTAMKNLLHPSLQEGKINRTFFELLQLVYCFALVEERDPRPFPLAVNHNFDGIEAVSSLLEQAKQRNTLKNTTHHAIMKGFEHYTAFVQLTQSGQWSDGISKDFVNLLSGADHNYIAEKYQQKSYTELYSRLNRHISFLKLLNYYFDNTPLPEAAYQLLWGKLNLKDAVMGRNQVWYGRLREIALEHCPYLDKKVETKEENPIKTEDSTPYTKIPLSEIRKDCTALCVAMLDQDDQTRISMMEDYFSREDVKKAMENHEFVEVDILRYMICEEKPSYIMEYLITYCENHPKVWLRDEVIEAAKSQLKKIAIKIALQEDSLFDPENTGTSAELRPFFRYFFHVAFPYAQMSEDSIQIHSRGGNKSYITLRSLLAQQFPFSATLAEGFLDFPTPRGNHFSLDDFEIKLEFHHNYVAYFINGEQLLAPKFPFSAIEEVEDEILFWSLLPITIEYSHQGDKVFQNLLKRLNTFPFLENLNVELMASCLTDNLCQRAEGSNLPPVFRLNREINRDLFTAEIYTQNGYVRIIKTNFMEFRVLSQEMLDNFDDAIAFGEKQLDLYTLPFDVDSLLLERLPFRIAIHCDLRAEHRLEPTEENVKKALKMFRSGETSRVLLYFQGFELILLNSKEKIACFIFDIRTRRRYTLVANQSVYQTVDSKDVVYEEFHLKTLETYLIFEDVDQILRNLNFILQDIQRENFGSLWSSEIYQKAEKLHVDRWLLGGSPVHQMDGHIGTGEKPPKENQPKIGGRPFFIEHFPVKLDIVEIDGASSVLEITKYNRSRVNEQLFLYLRGYLKQLRLIWEEGQTTELLYEEDKFALIYSDKNHPPLALLKDRNGTEYQVETMLCGHILSQNQMHDHTLLLRGFLETLMACIHDPDKVLEGEFGVV